MLVKWVLVCFIEMMVFTQYTKMMSLGPPSANLEASSQSIEVVDKWIMKFQFVLFEALRLMIFQMPVCPECSKKFHTTFIFPRSGKN
jgi:hypothetical protein